jgi:hypothetical protein
MDQKHLLKNWLSGNKGIRFAALACVVIFFSGCETCNKESHTYAFTQGDLRVVPYAGNETIAFKSALGDSISYPCIGRVNKTDIPITVNTGSCDKLEFHIPLNSTIFVAGQDSLGLQLSVGFITTNLVRKVFNITFTDLKDFSIKGYSWNYNFDSDTIVLFPSYSYETDGVASYSDSLTIIHKKFKRVYSLTGRKNPAISDEFIRTVYYTLQEGVVGFQTNKTTRWEIK